jgi:hypothetical protein
MGTTLAAPWLEQGGQGPHWEIAPPALWDELAREHDCAIGGIQKRCYQLLTTLRAELEQPRA